MRRYRLGAAVLLAVLATVVACGSVSGPKDPPGGNSGPCVVGQSKLGECTL